MGRKFAYDYDDLIIADDELRKLEIRAINLRFGSEHVLLLSPDLDDEDIALSWPEDKKMSDAPGALACNQIVAFCWHNSEQKWVSSPPTVEGHTLTYAMYGLNKAEGEAEHCIIVRQWFDTPKVYKNKVTVRSRFAAVSWSKCLLSLSTKDGGVSQDDRFAIHYRNL